MNKVESILGVVVHWRNERQLERLIQAWPDRDPSFPLLVVDNSGSTGPLSQRFERVRWLEPPTNLGFGGGASAAFREAATHPDLQQIRWLLLLNPDTVVSLDALRELADAATEAEAAGEATAMIAPRLTDSSGIANQFQWQLRPLPRRRHLWAQCLFLGQPRGPRVEPAAGARVEQPAAGALLLRREAIEKVGGFDPRFSPAWFEDVDLAYRLHAAGFHGRYHPLAEINHDRAGSIPSLGFARFLRIYYRNLRRFAEARGWRWTAQLAPRLLALAAILRLPLLIVRRPRAARTRAEAATALLQLARFAAAGLLERSR